MHRTRPWTTRPAPVGTPRPPEAKARAAPDLLGGRPPLRCAPAGGRRDRARALRGSRRAPGRQADVAQARARALDPGQVLGQELPRRGDALGCPPAQAPLDDRPERAQLGAHPADLPDGRSIEPGAGQRGDELDRHQAAQQDVAGQKDRAHAPAAELVVTEGRPGNDGQVARCSPRRAGPGRGELHRVEIVVGAPGRRRYIPSSDSGRPLRLGGGAAASSSTVAAPESPTEAKRISFIGLMTISPHEPDRLTPAGRSAWPSRPPYAGPRRHGAQRGSGASIAARSQPRPSIRPPPSAAERCPAESIATVAAVRLAEKKHIPQRITPYHLRERKFFGTNGQPRYTVEVQHGAVDGEDIVGPAAPHVGKLNMAHRCRRRPRAAVEVQDGALVPDDEDVARSASPHAGRGPHRPAVPSSSRSGRRNAARCHEPRRRTHRSARSPIRRRAHDRCPLQTSVSRSGRHSAAPLTMPQRRRRRSLRSPTRR